MNKITKFILKSLLWTMGIALTFFVVTFTVYFFNLDMKLTAALEPIFLKHYDRIERDTHI